MSALDSAINNDFLMISKSLIPYLDTDKQKAMAIFIKSFELMSTIDLFSKEEFVRTITKPREAGWEKSFLSEIRSNLSNDKGFFIDAILKLSEVKDLLAVKNTDSVQQSFTSPKPTDMGIPASPPANTAYFSSSTQNSNNSSEQTTPNTSNNQVNPAQIIDKLSGVLEPSQLQLLKVLSAFIK